MARNPAEQSEITATEDDSEFILTDKTHPMFIPTEDIVVFQDDEYKIQDTPKNTETVEADMPKDYSTVETDILKDYSEEKVYDEVILDNSAENSHTKSITQPSIPILEDVLDEETENKDSGIRVNKQSVNPIRAVFENRYNETWISPENILFTSVNINPKKTGQIMARKKMPINPKYKKSFLDLLLKR